MTSDREAFLHTLTEQIRCVKARDSVAREIACHIEDQAEALEAHGLDREAALKEAVRRMGDPVEIGTQLDLIHRPQTNWRLILLIALCSIGGLAVQCATGILETGQGALLQQCLYLGLGFLVMLGIYFLDYGFIGIWAKELFLTGSVVAVLGLLFLVPEINGMRRGGILYMYLFVPLYAGILYQYRGKGFLGIIRACLWIFLPVMISWKCIPSLPTAGNLFLICSVMVLAAVAKGWFSVDRKKTILFLIFIGVILPVLFLAFSYCFLMLEYQKARLLAFLNPLADAYGTGYVANQIRELLTGGGLGLFTGISGGDSLGSFAGIPVGDSLGSFTGISGGDGQWSSSFTSIDNSYGLIQLVFSYGLVFGLAVIIAFAKLVMMAFQISRRQSNQLGFMIGFGCRMIFLVMCLEGVAMNFTLFPGTTVILPFLSRGGSAVIVYDILLGLLLAVHRCANILGEVKDSPGWRRKRRIRLQLTVEPGGE